MTDLTRNLDAAIGRLMDELDVGPFDFEVEKLMRMGAFPVDGERWTVNKAADRLGFYANSLQEKLRRRDLPSILTLLTWGAVVSSMYQWSVEPGWHGGMSLEAWALKYGWTTANALSDAVKRTTGLRPLDWLNAGASMEVLTDALLETWTVEQAA